MSRTNLIVCVCTVCALALTAVRYLSLPFEEDIPIIPPDHAMTKANPAQIILFGGKIDINTADAEAFEVLEGIGPARASRIVDDRADNGFFRSVDDLRRVYGIGKKTLEKNRNYLMTGEQSARLRLIQPKATSSSGNDDDI